MTPEHFAYWLQGFAELHGLHGPTPPTDAQWHSIREHLGTVFTKITPAMNASTPVEPDQNSIYRGLSSRTDTQIC